MKPENDKYITSLEIPLELPGTIVELPNIQAKIPDMIRAQVKAKSLM